jgi:hypothetical protein
MERLMTKPVFSLLVLVVLCSPLGAQNIVNATLSPSSNDSCWSGAPCTRTIPATTAGNALIVMSADTNASTNSYVSTASGATFAIKCNTVVGTAGNESNIKIQLAYNVPGGITGVTYGGSGNYIDSMIFEVSGLVAGDPFVACAAAANPSGGSNPQSSGVVTTVNANDFVISFLAQWFGGNTNTYTWIAPFTTGASANAGGYGYMTASTPQTITPTANTSNTTGKINGGTIVLKAAGGATKLCTLSLMGAGPC